jgi:hypothetical protein
MATRGNFFKRDWPDKAKPDGLDLNDIGESGRDWSFGLPDPVIAGTRSVSAGKQNLVSLYKLSFIDGGFIEGAGVLPFNAAVNFLAPVTFSSSVAFADVTFPDPVTFMDEVTLAASGVALIHANGLESYLSTGNGFTALSLNRNAFDDVQAVPGKHASSIRLESDATKSNIVLATSAAINSQPVDRVMIDMAGNVGIGTNSPLSRLHIALNASNTPIVRITNLANGADLKNWQAYIDPTGAMVFNRLNDLWGPLTTYRFNVDGSFQLNYAQPPAGTQDKFPGFLFARDYNDIGDSMDLVWCPQAGNSGNRLLRISGMATAGGFGGVVFYCQAGGTDGYFNEIARISGDEGLKIASAAWNTPHFKMGPFHLWIDIAGRLRIKSTAPNSDTDGTVVGAQV